MDYFLLYKPDGLVEDTPTSHAGGRGSIPGSDKDSFSIAKCQLIASRGIISCLPWDYKSPPVVLYL